MPKSSEAAGTYVYCAIAARKAPAVGMKQRLPGTGRVRLLEVKPSRYLVVGSAPLTRFGEEAMRTSLSDLDWVSRAAVAHESVVEAFLDADALLPMKLFTIFTSDERAIAELRRSWPRVERALRRLAGRVEWGVRLSLAGSPNGTRPGSPALSRATSLSGRDYLLAKGRQRRGAQSRVRQARRQAAALFKTLSVRATAARRRTLAAHPDRGGRLVLDAAFLVPSRHSSDFRARAARLARSLESDGLDLQLTGPWPPYSFIERS
jgi:hypothetical protein